MTYQNQTREQLVNLSISELRAECSCLLIPHRRSKEDCITDILAAQPQKVLVAANEQAMPMPVASLDEATVEIKEKVDDYLFHNEQPTNLPQVNDTHLIGDFLLRCIEVGGEDYVTIWDVKKHGSMLGEIKMGWDCFWYHTMSQGMFSTPQEAVIDLYESMQAFLEKERIQSEEPITFEKVADSRWESDINGVLVRITSDDSGYKCNLTKNAVFADYDTAIMQSLVAVAFLQEKRLLERTQRANTIQVLFVHNDRFVVQNSKNKSRYVVRPNHLDPNQRCECADCVHRGSKCKHQIAVENFLEQRLVKA